MMTRRSLLTLIPAPLLARFAPDAVPAVGDPVPARTFAVRRRAGNGWVTAIFRQWNKGDAARCNLCPRERCCAEGDACLIAVGELVPVGKAAGFSTVQLWAETEPEEGGVR